MKISKRIILIIIVVAVAAYLLWKQGVFGKKDDTEKAGTSSDSGGSSSSGLTTDQIIDRITGDPAAHKHHFREIVRQILSSAEWTESVQKWADEKGVSFAQAAVINASYTDYYVNQGGAGWAKNYHQQVYDQVMAM